MTFPAMASRRWCLLLLSWWVFITPAVVDAQPRAARPAPKYLQLTPPNQVEGGRILAEMRAAEPAGDYFFEFELRVLPRRGPQTRIPGRLWGGRNEGVNLARMILEVPGSDGGAPTEERLLVRGGASPAAWRWTSAAPAEPVRMDGAALFTPLAGTGLSAFELQMQFLYWPEFVYEGKTRLLDRPTDAFLLYPSAEVAAARPELSAVRVYLDPNYHALVQAELLGADGRVLKTMRMVELRKLEEVWVVRAVEIRDEVTRDKTRFVALAGGVKQSFSPVLFEPGRLPDFIKPPASLVRLTD